MDEDEDEESVQKLNPFRSRWEWVDMEVVLKAPNCWHFCDFIGTKITHMDYDIAGFFDRVPPPLPPYYGIMGFLDRFKL